MFVRREAGADRHRRAADVDHTVVAGVQAGDHFDLLTELVLRVSELAEEHGMASGVRGSDRFAEHLFHLRCVGTIALRSH